MRIDIMPPLYLNPDALPLKSEIQPPSAEMLASKGEWGDQFMWHDKKVQRLIGMIEFKGRRNLRNQRPVYMPAKAPFNPQLYASFYATHKIKHNPQMKMPIDPLRCLHEDAQNNHPGALYLLASCSNMVDKNRYLEQVKQAKQEYAYYYYELARQIELNLQAREGKQNLQADLELEQEVSGGENENFYSLPNDGEPAQREDLVQYDLAGATADLFASNNWGLDPATAPVYNDESFLQAADGVSQDQATALAVVPRDLMLDPTAIDRSAISVKELKEKLISNYKKAADLCHRVANYLLAEEYMKMGKNKKAYQYLCKIKTGFPCVRYKIGRFLEAGECAEKDIWKAMMLYSEAAKGGHRDAKIRMLHLFNFAKKEFTLPDGTISFSREVDKSVEELAYEGETNAQFYYGILLEEDKFTHRPIWFKKAADQGHIAARCYYTFWHLRELQAEKVVKPLMPDVAQWIPSIKKARKEHSKEIHPHLVQLTQNTLDAINDWEEKWREECIWEMDEIYV